MKSTLVVKSISVFRLHYPHRTVATQPACFFSFIFSPVELTNLADLIVDNFTNLAGDFRELCRPFPGRVPDSIAPNRISLSVLQLGQRAAKHTLVAFFFVS